MKAHDWLGVPVATAWVLLSLALAAWVLTFEPEREAGIATPAPTSTATGEIGEIGTPLAGEPDVLALAERSRDVLVGLAARPGGPFDLVVVSSAGDTILAGDLRVSVDGRPAGQAARCGNGCFRFETPVLAGVSATIAVEVTRPGKQAAAVDFSLPERLPPSGADVLSKAEQTMGALGTLRMTETLTSGLGTVIRTEYALAAPDRIAFETSTGQQTVIVGPRRWDLEGSKWTESPFPAGPVPTYVWEEASLPRLLGPGTLDGAPVQVLALYDPELGPAWFRLSVARDGTVLEAEMLAPAHFMTQRFRDFGTPLTIEAPS